LIRKRNINDSQAIPQNSPELYELFAAIKSVNPQKIFFDLIALIGKRFLILNKE